MKSLKEIWREHLLPEQFSLLPNPPLSHADTVAYASFAVPEEAKILFVSNAKTLQLANKYTDLLPVTLTQDEARIVADNADRIKKSPPPYNYDNDYFLISDVLYDGVQNIVYVEARRAPYSLVSALMGNKFPKYCPINRQQWYGASAVAPFITKDGDTVLMEGRKFKNFAGAAGMLEPKGALKRLNFKNNISAVERTALDESLEEILGDAQGESRVSLLSRPSVSHILFRKSEGRLGFVEFIVPLTLNCSTPTLSHIIKTNQAKDRHEHTGVCKWIPLAPEERKIAVDFLKEKKGGQDIYHTMILSASRLYHRGYFGDHIQETLPYSRTRALDIKVITNPRIERPLRSSWSEKEEHRQLMKRADEVGQSY